MTLFSLSSRKITFVRVSYCKGMCSFSSMGSCVVKQVYCALQSRNVMWSVSFRTKYERKSVRQYCCLQIWLKYCKCIKKKQLFYRYFLQTCDLKLQWVPVQEEIPWFPKVIEIGSLMHLTWGHHHHHSVPLNCRVLSAKRKIMPKLGFQEPMFSSD